MAAFEENFPPGNPMICHPLTCFKRKVTSRERGPPAPVTVKTKLAIGRQNHLRLYLRLDGTNHLADSTSLMTMTNPHSIAAKQFIPENLINCLHGTINYYVPYPQNTSCADHAVFEHLSRSLQLLFDNLKVSCTHLSCSRKRSCGDIVLNT